MQQVLPTNLDRTSAQVVGFDVDAYINSTPSTLNQRLNIPANFNSGDYLAGNLAKPQKKKKSKLPAIIAAAAVTAGGAALAYMGLKGKLPEPKVITSTVKPFFDKVTKNISDAAKNIWHKIKK